VNSAKSAPLPLQCVRSPRRKGKNGVGLDARSTEGSKRDFRALYGCNNLTASSTNDEAFMAA
jgi:hypothetical protein